MKLSERLKMLKRILFHRDPFPFSSLPEFDIDEFLLRREVKRILDPGPDPLDQLIDNAFDAAVVALAQSEDSD